tara:strand:- start:320 stop:1225 length:906 start_codon:yes stop_codon:yes gene_type:complete
MSELNYRWGTWAQVGYKKYICPKCGKRTFVPLVDMNGNIVDATTYGRCDRDFKCGYSKRKSGNETVLGSYYYKNNNEFTAKENFGIIYKDIKMNSVSGWTTNNLVLYLYKNTKFHYDKICEKVYEYQIGTSTHKFNKGACIYWQTDANDKTRTGKIIQYDINSGKRDKSDKYPVKWMHRVLKLENFNLKQCLFGEHLLSMNKSMPVALVESEKTAFIQSLADNRYIWVATGGKQNIRRAKLILMGRDVTVFPDIDAEAEWEQIAKECGWKFESTMNLMKANGYTWDSGDDIADMTCHFKRK